MKFVAISKILLVLILPFLIFLIALNFAGFDMAFYEKKFLEYKVQQEVPEASSLNEKIIDFLRGKNNELPNEFNEREKQHLWDVRKIVSASTIALYAFIALFILLLVISFHRLFFEKGTYVFDPAKEMIVKLYPEQIFTDLGISISKWVILSSGAVILLGLFLSLKSKSKKNK
ncbi:DUF1461 domain-containing protein [Candidatus Woesearchaeota archaeon]|nr:DUF1461 domain-containing protein [Candidatus Woesearchaeota archaeon]